MSVGTKQSFSHLGEHFMEKLVSAGLTQELIQFLIDSPDNKTAIQIVKSLRDSYFSSGVTSTLLDLVHVTDVVGSNHFVTWDKFKLNSSSISLEYYDDYFQKQFLKRTELDIQPELVKSYVLKSDTLEVPIIKELNGKSEIKLCHIWQMMKNHTDDENTPLSPSMKNSNLFFLTGIDGEMYAVCLIWFRRGWRIITSASDRPRTWPAGMRVFSY
jgi:hypothetical protein